MCRPSFDRAQRTHLLHICVDFSPQSDERNCGTTRGETFRLPMPATTISTSPLRTIARLGLAATMQMPDILLGPTPLR